MPQLTNAALEWDAAGWPRSLSYGDIYYSSADALGESTHVFLDGNRLSERWRAPGSRHFVIGELGFGSGLNFMNACRLWCDLAPAGSTLHYVGCELHPLAAADMQRVHAHWPALHEFSSALLAHYPDHTAGVHQLVLQLHGREIRLTLLYGDAAQLLASVARPHGFRVDAWFLDGFAPKLNPQLWQSELLRVLAGLSHAGTTLATYSVAGEFRRNLAAAGFTVRKIRGYASKRQMVQAEMPSHDATSVHADTRSVCVVGGGLAGCSTAWELAQSGWQVYLLEQEHALATQGSGNPQGILHCNLSTLDSAANQFNLHAFLYAARYYDAFSSLHDTGWQRSGMMQVAVIPRLQKRFRQLAESGSYAPALFEYLDAAAASALAGITLDAPALHYAASGWLSPPMLCKAWASHPGITVQSATRVSALEQTSGGWQLHLQSGAATSTLETARVVLCNGADLHLFPQTRHYPVIGNRGQVDVYAPVDTPHTRTILCGQGYILPSTGAQQSIGGSYYVGDSSERAVTARTHEHLAFAAQLIPELAAAFAQRTPLLQRQGMRCVTPDRMPLAGPAFSAVEEGGREYVGLYLNVGHGSHGLTRTPFCAAWLASLFNGTPPPFGNELAQLVLPERYVRME
jgi:tRNA 5-methylaminomethyl-2-thiouridine biosynthesis bifunctional protein